MECFSSKICYQCTTLTSEHFTVVPQILSSHCTVYTMFEDAPVVYDLMRGILFILICTVIWELATFSGLSLDKGDQRWAHKVIWLLATFSG